MNVYKKNDIKFNLVMMWICLKKKCFGGGGFRKIVKCVIFNKFNGWNLVVFFRLIKLKLVMKVNNV